jgi:hypothetical protein
MKKIKLVLAACLLVVAADAQQVIRLYAGTPPGNLTDRDKEMYSAPANGRPTVRNVTMPTLTVFIPKHRIPRDRPLLFVPVAATGT